MKTQEQKSSNQPNRFAIAIVGMSGSGKTEAGHFFEEKGLQTLRFGSVVDEGIREEGLPWSPENNVYYRKKIRQELGMAAIAIKMLPKIEEVLRTNERVVLDGLYSWAEYTYLKDKLPNLIILAIYTRPSIRHSRLKNRKDRPFSEADAKRRDITEIEDIDKGGPIAMADYLIKNERSFEDFKEELETFWKLLKTWSI